MPAAGEGANDFGLAAHAGDPAALREQYWMTRLLAQANDGLQRERGGGDRQARSRLHAVKRGLVAHVPQRMLDAVQLDAERLFGRAERQPVAAPLVEPYGGAVRGHM